MADIHHQEQNCRFFVGSEEVGVGNLSITSEIVMWEQNEGDKTIKLRYKEIAIHAVSKDLNSFPHECLYIMYNGIIDGISPTGGDESQDEEEEEPLEIRIVPHNNNCIKRMFDVMSDCQCLHPDTDDSDDSQEEHYFENGGGDAVANAATVQTGHPTLYEGGAGEGFYTTEEGFQHLTPQGQATLNRLEQMLTQSQITENGNENNEIPENGQFDDV